MAGPPLKIFKNLQCWNKEDLAWLAGIIDGEGWITMMHKTYPTIGVSNTDLGIINRVRDMFECTITNQHFVKNPKIKPIKKAYRCVLVGNKAKIMIEILRPFMVSTKRDKYKPNSK